MVNFRPFAAADAFQMDWIEEADFVGMLRADRYVFERLEQEGSSETMVNEDTGNILGIIVFTPYCTNAVNLNMFMSKNIQKEFDKDIFKALRNIVNDARKRFVRVSLEGKSSNYKLMKLIRALGFKEEGVMRKYGWKGEDYTLFSVVEE